MFTTQPYNTFQPPNAKIPLQIVNNDNPHFVLLHIKIPPMDRLEILNHIKQIHPHINVIIITAYPQ
ncbi:response regulator, partial [Paenibacillus xylanexedens]|uniref:response regulator n=1 Tax=Paenibacillus xylanexedens TaxID=528191 RepID=UPI0021B216F6